MKYNLDFGMPTLIELNSLEENVLLCNELGLQFIELNMNLPEYQTDRIDIKKINSYREKYDIYFTIHLDENLNVWDFNKYVADAYLNTVKDTIEIAKKINVPMINMHMNNGIYFTLPNQKVYLFNEYLSDYMQKTSDFERLCDECIGNSNIKISIENTDGFMDYQRQAIKRLVKNDNFTLTYDVGHSFCIDDVDLSLIKENMDKLYHIHLHDAKGNKNHLPLGEGDVDIIEKLDMAMACGCRVVVETKTVDSLKKSIDVIKNIEEY